MEKLELFAELFARVFCTTIPSKHLWYIYGNSATFFRWLYQLAEGKISSTLYISNQNKSEKGMIYDQTQEILLQWNKDVLTAEQLSHLNHSRLKRYIEGGAEIEKVKGELTQFTDKKLVVDIKEIKRPDKDAQLVAENIALQLENRISFRRAMKSCMSRTMKSGALGVKTSVSGRLGGADMARTEFYSEGTIPLQTLRADIDYGFAEANTTYGKVGVKVWVYKGEILPEKAAKEGRD